jgi:hypothetical protein
VSHSIAKGRRRRAGRKQRAKTRIDAHESRFFGAGRAFSLAGVVPSAAGDDGAIHSPARSRRNSIMTGILLYYDRNM